MKMTRVRCPNWSSFMDFYDFHDLDLVEVTAEYFERLVLKRLVRVGFVFTNDCEEGIWSSITLQIAGET